MLVLAVVLGGFACVMVGIVSTFVYVDAINRNEAVTMMNQRELALQSSMAALAETHNSMVNNQRKIDGEIESLRTRISVLSPAAVGMKGRL